MGDEEGGEDGGVEDVAGQGGDVVDVGVGEGAGGEGAVVGGVEGCAVRRRVGHFDVLYIMYSKCSE